MILGIVRIAAVWRFIKLIKDWRGVMFVFRILMIVIIVMIRRINSMIRVRQLPINRRNLIKLLKKDKLNLHNYNKSLMKITLRT